MTTDESSRLHLYDCARSTWGDEAAGFLLTSLPHTADRFATKDDLAVLSAELRAEISTGVGSLRAEMHEALAHNLRTTMLGMIASNATLVGLVFAAVKLG